MNPPRFFRKPWRGSSQKVILSTQKNLGDKIQISVSDNGSGYSRIPSRQKSSNHSLTTKRLPIGTGLGLSLKAMILLKRMGEIESRRNMGSGTILASS